MIKRKLTSAALAGALFAAAGCSSTDSGGDSPHRMLVPARQLNVSPSLTIPAEAFAVAAIAWVIIDPLAPNWKVEVESMGQHRFRVDLTMKRFITGGEGEAAAVVKRTAEKLRKEGGYVEYALLELTEGIESRVPIAQRVAHAVVELR
jgi:hypothetical protein